MKASRLNAARRMGKLHAAMANPPTYTPRQFQWHPLWTVYWKARNGGSLYP
jgi:hypothetical protein